MSEKNRFNIQPGVNFDDIEPLKIERTEYIDPEQEINDLIKTAEFDYSKDVPKPPTIISYKGAPIGTLGNFTLVYGKAKSKKTFSTTMLMAAALNGSWGDFKGHLPPEKSKVIFFDTEQSDYHLYKTARRVTKLIDHQGLHDKFKVYKLRRHQQNRARIIEAVLERSTGVGLVVIDGVRDLLTNINDPDQATQTADLLLKWTDTYNMHIITILHQNKGDKNARGHIGSELINKCETAISVDIDPHDKNISKVEVSESRDMPFEPFAFRINPETVLPEIIEGWTPTIPTDPANRVIKKPRPYDLDPLSNYNILSWTKGKIGEDGIKYRDLVNMLKQAVSEKTGHSIGNTIAGDYFTYYHSTEGYIVKDGNTYTIELPPAPGGTTSKLVQAEAFTDKLHDQDPF
jgi:hypothetical protein